MSKVILYGGTLAARSALADRLVKDSPKHSVVNDWNGVAAIEPNSIVLTDLVPPFDLPLDCLVVGVGCQRYASCDHCEVCSDDCLPF